MRKIALIILIILTIVGLWLWHFPFGSWRYRMTITVETPEGIRSGSAVREVYLNKDINIAGSGLNRSAKGEAVAVDLGARGVLFGLMDSANSSDYTTSVFFSAFPIPGGRQGSLASWHNIRYYDQLKNTKTILPPSQYPMLVRFKEISDPKSAELVNPDDLAARFGAGVILKNITLETTDDPITVGIDKLLTWLPSRKHVIGYLGGWPEDPTGLHLNGSEFSEGLLP